MLVIQMTTNSSCSHLDDEGHGERGGRQGAAREDDAARAHHLLHLPRRDVCR